MLCNTYCCCCHFANKNFIYEGAEVGQLTTQTVKVQEKSLQLPSGITLVFFVISTLVALIVIPGSMGVIGHTLEYPIFMFQMSQMFTLKGSAVMVSIGGIAVIIVLITLGWIIKSVLHGYPKQVTTPQVINQFEDEYERLNMNIQKVPEDSDIPMNHYYIRKHSDREYSVVMHWNFGTKSFFKHFKKLPTEQQARQSFLDQIEHNQWLNEQLVAIQIQEYTP